MDLPTRTHPNIGDDNDTSLYSIGQAASFLNVSVDTLRRWEAKGTIKASRSEGNLRQFTKAELQRVKQQAEQNDFLLSISEAAKKLDVSIQTLRRWDKSGRLVAQRDDQGERLYPRKAIEELKADLQRHPRPEFDRPSEVRPQTSLPSTPSLPSQPSSPAMTHHEEIANFNTSSLPNPPDHPNKPEIRGQSSGLPNSSYPPNTPDAPPTRPHEDSQRRPREDRPRDGERNRDQERDQQNWQDRERHDGQDRRDSPRFEERPQRRDPGLEVLVNEVTELKPTQSPQGNTQEIITKQFNEFSDRLHQKITGQLGETKGRLSRLEQDLDQTTDQLKTLRSYVNERIEQTTNKLNQEHAHKTPQAFIIDAQASAISNQQPEFNDQGQLIRPYIEEHGHNSAGVGFLPAGSTKMVLKTTAVTHNCLIFVTPTSITGSTLTVPLSLPEEGFAVVTTTPSTRDITFNWLIISLT